MKGEIYFSKKGNIFLVEYIFSKHFTIVKVWIHSLARYCRQTASQVVLVIKDPPPNSDMQAGDTASIPGLGTSPEEGNGNSLQYFCLDNSMDRGAWWAIVHRITKSQTPLKRLTTQT